MERVVNKASSHEEARRWDIEQHVSMTPQARLRAARELKDRVYPSDAKDVRECPRDEQAPATSRRTLSRLFSALDEFWEGDVPGLQGPQDLGSAGTIIQFGQPPNRLDLINSIDGVDFAEAWQGRLEAVLVDDLSYLTRG